MPRVEDQPRPRDEVTAWMPVWPLHESVDLAFVLQLDDAPMVTESRPSFHVSTRAAAPSPLASTGPLRIGAALEGAG